MAEKKLEKFYHQNRHYVKNKGTGRIATFEKIKKHYLLDDNYDEFLSEDEMRMLNRIKTAYTMLIKHNPVIKPREIAKSLMDIYSISERQAYRDIHNSQELFGELEAVNKQFLKVKYISWLEDLVSLANAKHDFRTAVDAIKLIYQISGLDKLDEANEDERPSVFQLNILVDTKDGQKRIIQDMDSLEEIPLSEFNTITTTLNKPRVGIAEMAKMLDDED